jgi:hypothetical protein
VGDWHLCVPHQIGEVARRLGFLTPTESTWFSPKPHRRSHTASL